MDSDTASDRYSTDFLEEDFQGVGFAGGGSADGDNHSRSHSFEAEGKRAFFARNAIELTAVEIVDFDGLYCGITCDATCRAIICEQRSLICCYVVDPGRRIHREIDNRTCPQLVDSRRCGIEHHCGIALADFAICETDGTFHLG